MESKYYTPGIEEFHVGFEYESRILAYEDSWTKGIVKASFVYGEGWVSNIDWILCMYEDGCEEFRVKYLDQADIEELGFPYIKKGWSENSKIFRRNQGNGIEIYFRNLDYTLQISHGSGLVIFEGTIKNKSELKKLLKQLNIK